MSALSMMLCMAMLVSSTFAWFTDSVTSGNNRIVAGNLDVELYYKNASTGDWKDASAANTENPNFFVDKDGKEIDRLYIDIDIQLNATQYTYEEDSFGNQYDDGLYPPDEDGALKRVLDDNTVIYYLDDGEVLLHDTQNVNIGEDGVYTVPAGITTIGEGAFRNMPNLKTFTIEGNPTVASFAGRSCKNLETVILTGDDVTFTGTSQVFTHADTGNAAGITIYVVNDTVKDRLIAAQQTARGYTVEFIDIGTSMT